MVVASGGVGWSAVHGGVSNMSQFGASLAALFPGQSLSNADSSGDKAAVNRSTQNTALNKWDKRKREADVILVAKKRTLKLSQTSLPIMLPWLLVFGLSSAVI